MQTLRALAASPRLDMATAGYPENHDAENQRTRAENCRCRRMSQTAIALKLIATARSKTGQGRGEGKSKKGRGQGRPRGAPKRRYGKLNGVELVLMPDVCGELNGEIQRKRGRRVVSLVCFSAAASLRRRLARRERMRWILSLNRNG